MIDTGAYLPLRLFHSVDEDSLSKYECEGFSHREYFWSPSGYLLPFQSSEVVANQFKVLEICSNTLTAVSLPLQTVTAKNGDVLYIYMGGAVDIDDGMYVLKNGDTYSDPFIIGDTENMIHLKYRNPIYSEEIESWDNENIYWHENLYGECYINSSIEKPSYPILEEVREDGAMTQHKVFQRWEKRHQIRLFGVESMADALSLLPTMDEVYINSQRVYNVLVNVEWEDDRECLAEITITFSVRQLLKTF